MLWYALALLPALVAAKADYYYRPCSKLLFKTSTYGGAMKGMSSTEMYEMLCGSDDFQASVGQCIITAADLVDTTTSTDKMHRVSWEYFGYICNYYDQRLSNSWDEIALNIDQNPVNTTSRIAIAAATLEAKNVPLTGLSWYRARHDPIVFGWGLVGYVCIVIGVQALLNGCRWFAPRLYRGLVTLPMAKEFRWWFSLPPALGPKASTAVHNSGQRLHYFWIGLLVVLNIALTVCDYDRMSFSSLYNPKDMAMSSAIGFRTGYLAMYQLPIVFLFAARNNLLISLTGWDMCVFNLWHRWLSRIVLVQSVAHAAAYHIMYSKEGMLATNWTESYWIWGFIATMCMGIMALHGSKQLRALAYDFFVFAHVVLAIVCLVGLNVHLWYTDQTKATWWLCLGFWVADRALRLCRIVFNGLNLTAMAAQDTSNTVTLTINTKFKNCGGCYVFIHFMHPLLFWQSHPFTLVPNEDGTTKVVLKPRDGITKWVLGKCATQSQLRVFIDGPYGTPINFEPFDTVSFIAGGIGITAIYSHVMAIGADALAKKSVMVDWIVSNRGEVDYFRPELERLQQAQVQLRLHITNSDTDSATEVLSVLPTKQDEQVVEEEVCPCSGSDEKRAFLLKTSECHPVTQLDRIVMLAAAECQKSLAYFICGPSALIRDARERASLQAGASSKYIQIFDESFSM